MSEGVRPATVELRVHGVGGTTPERMLGVGGPEETVRVAGGWPSSFHARRADPSVEGYVWGGLTSGASLQPLWIFLLPYTLLNVAGWLHRPGARDGRASLRVRLHREVVRLLGYALTAATVTWLAILVIDLLAYQWAGQAGFLGLGEVPAWLRVLAGGAVVAAAVLVAAVVAGQSQLGFEALDGPAAPPGIPVPEQGDPSEPDWSLESPRFWQQAPASRRLLTRHLLVALAMLAMLVATALAAALQPQPPASPQLGSLFVVVGTAQFVLLGTLLLLDLLGLMARRRPALPDRWGSPLEGFRFFGSTVAAVLATALLNAFFTGAMIWLVHRSRAAGIPVRTGSELALVDVFGLALIAMAACLVVWAAWHCWARDAWAQDVPLSTAGPAEPLNGIPSRPRPAGRGGLLLSLLAWRRQDARPAPGREGKGFRRKIARARSFSNAIRNLDLVLSPPALLFLSLGTWAGLERLAVERLAGWPWQWQLSFDAGRWALPVGAPLAALASTLGQWALLYAAAGGVLLLRLGLLQRGVRRQIGILWDVLTFWPRRFHPLAVRPYAERAVPELQHRLAVHQRAGRFVVLSAHSQGTVLAVAALLSCPWVRPSVALVTVGSPLAQLYARWFPAYFGVSGQFQRLRDQLAGGRERGWRNFWRETDYIGKRVFPGDDPQDVCLHDPARGPGTGPGAFPAPTPPPDLDRVTWTELARHSQYLNEPAVKEWVRQLHALPDAPAPTPGGAGVTP